MTNDAMRIWKLEQRLQADEQKIQQLQDQLNKVAQSQYNQPPVSAGGGGGSNAVYVFWPGSGGISGATWSGGVPVTAGSTSVTVYQVEGSSTVTNLGGKIVYNWLPAAVLGNKACYCLPDGLGHYIAISQSCT